jgi:Zn-dependent M28 family amino/carboxypeptidase
MKHFSILSIILLLLLGCGQQEEPPLISKANLKHHIEILAADSFMGRQPSTKGGEMTEAYISRAFEEAGVQPGNGSSYYQEVPLVEITPGDMSPLALKSDTGSFALNYKNEFVASTRHLTQEVNLRNSEVVFAGFGIVAPEYGWNDYEDIDVEGKTVVVLVNDSGFGEGNEEIFKDDAMTYYGRWTYKYEEAAQQGAAAVLVVHETEPASYPWGVVENSFTGKDLTLQAPDSNKRYCKVEGWISKGAAEKLFASAGMAGYNFRDEARKEGFEPFSLGLEASLSFANSFASNTSNNVVGIVEGTERPDEYIIYSGHWDHLGVGKPENGDSIYNGAVDNATGIAAMIEIGRNFAAMEEGPKRSVVLLAVTAEESGLLGSKHYAENPVYPPSQTVANINMDALYPYGKYKDVTIVGYGQSELDEVADSIARSMGRYVQPNAHPEAGYFYRSDHFNFAKIGIPALYAKGSAEDMDKGKAFAGEKYDYYRDEIYHQPDDEANFEAWNMDGLAFEVEFMYKVGMLLANGDKWPRWKEGSEFKVIRQRSKM